MIIDFHTHIVPPEIKERREELTHEDPCLGELFRDPKLRMSTADELINSMDEDGIAISVVVNMGWSSIEMCKKTNDYIISSVSKYRDRLVGFGVVDPRWEEAQKEIERCAEGGLLGIGELMPHLQGYAIDDRETMEAVIETATEHNMIILTHSSEPVGHIYQGKGNIFPGRLYGFISNFPHARIVCAHWGGGLPFYALMPEVRSTLENVWFDTAASPFLYRYDIFRIVGSLVGYEKILFGSDYPLIPQRRIIDGLDDKSSLTGEQKTIILGNNARELLNK